MNDHDHDLIITGSTLGLLHVLLGPDHLSALAALSVGSSWKAFNLGFRWGIGHSSGLVFVAIIFISMKGDLDLKRLGRYCDLLVGIFMIGLGCYGILGALRTFNQKRRKRDPDISYLDEESEFDLKETSTISSPVKNHSNNKLQECATCLLIDMKDPVTQRIISFCIGLLHGIAGPGGILGVLPAVEMQSIRSASLYLGSFVIMSTLSMGTFAAGYGELTKRIGATAESVEFGLNVFSSALSIVVGTVWFVLSLFGKLEEYFH